MFPTPLSLGLTICDYAMVEEGSRKVSMIGTIRRMTANEFPFHAPRFHVCAALTDGEGSANIELVIVDLETNEDVYIRTRSVVFPGRLRELYVLFRIDNCIFPEEGHYEVTLFVDGELVAQRGLLINARN
jgi:hypothetical protein